MSIIYIYICTYKKIILRLLNINQIEFNMLQSLDTFRWFFRKKNVFGSYFEKKTIVIKKGNNCKKIFIGSKNDTYNNIIYNFPYFQNT